MVDEQFKSLEELYDRLLPALSSKKKEFINSKLTWVTEKHIWECLKEIKWKRTHDITLFDLVNDILYLSEEELINYFMNKQKIEKDKQ